MCAFAVVARRRSEGTYPINKTTRVTIEFNRKKNGFQSTNGVDEGERARGDPRSKSPSTYAPLLFIVPNFHSQRTGDSPVRQKGEREKEISRERRAKEKRRYRKTVFASDRNVFGICFLVEVNDTDFVHFLFFPGGDRKSTVMFARSRRSERDRELRKGEVDFSSSWN